mmetsp:Transcript_49106/g.129827  ORF Transcript_49106/g.129827 Transcript_49106/m.129827 type:complete len:354 (+) Transcript_49106:72-1133(+)
MCKTGAPKAGRAQGAPWADAACARVLRWLPAVLLAAHVGGVADLDAPVAAGWGKIGSMDFFKKPMAEAYVAAFGFLGWIILFSLADAIPGLARFRMAGFAKDTKPAHLIVVHGALIWASFLVVGEPFGRAAPAAVLAAHVLCAYLAGSLAVLRGHDGMVWYTLRAYLQFMGYLAGIAVLHLFKTPAASSWSAVTAGRLACEVAFGVVAYDFLFSWLHYGMHHVFPKFVDHHQHHQITRFSGRLLAADTVNHGLLDFALQVGVNIVVQNIPIFGTPKHKLSRFLHNIVVTGLLVESHAGYDGFWSTHRLYPGVMGGAKRHVEHHTKGKSYYQQFFCYLDDFVFPSHDHRARESH